VAASRTGRVVVVGAGLAGLCAARHLSAAGVEVCLLEAGDDVGGRVRTDLVDGFRLDRGFQVLNTSYPAARAMLDLDALDLRFFTPGALLCQDGRRHPLVHPGRRPRGALDAVRAPLGSPLDKARLATVLGRIAASRGPALVAAAEASTEQALRARGLGHEAIESLLRPLLAGMVGESELTTTSRFCDLLLRSLARGRSGVPAAGMAAIPRQLAAGLPEGTLRLRTEVTAVSADRVTTADGEIGAAAVIVATDAAAALELLPGLHEPAFNGFTTLYHVPDAPPLAEPSLLLEAGKDGPVTNTAVLSAVAPSYAPAGRALVVSTVVGTAEPPGGHAELERQVRAHLGRMYGVSTARWEHLRTYRLPRALPAMPVPHNFRRPVRVLRGLYVCGDHRDSSSLQGAMVSGRRAAQTALADLRDG
jgi:phytoene dehydrogenase-like protein